ncbi:MAG: L-threonylcarbamoyladenylate synthase, partial [Janthinobacterium lividum]
MPETLLLRADQPGHIQRAAEILRCGGLVAFPTETVYGLGAHALSSEAVGKIFEAKQRPAWDPLIVHIADPLQMKEIARLQAELATRVRLLSDAFWPGPLTLLLPRTAVVPDEVTAGRPLVGVRWPSHPVAQALLQAAGVPVAAPSANRFGHVSPTTAQHVLHDLDGRIDAVLDGGATTVGIESTVLDPTQTPMMLYRAGAVTPEMLRQ